MKPGILLRGAAVAALAVGVIEAFGPKAMIFIGAVMLGAMVGLFAVCVALIAKEN
jgi:hypothetical protein